MRGGVYSIFPPVFGLGYLVIKWRAVLANEFALFLPNFILLVLHSARCIVKHRKAEGMSGMCGLCQNLIFMLFGCSNLNIVLGHALQHIYAFPHIDKFPIQKNPVNTSVFKLCGQSLALQRMIHSLFKSQRNFPPLCQAFRPHRCSLHQSSESSKGYRRLSLALYRYRHSYQWKPSLECALHILSSV